MGWTLAVTVRDRLALFRVRATSTRGSQVAISMPFFSAVMARSEEHTSELQSLRHLVCRLLLEKKKCQGTGLPRMRGEGGPCTHRAEGLWRSGGHAQRVGRQAQRTNAVSDGPIEAPASGECERR